MSPKKRSIGDKSVAAPWGKPHRRFASGFSAHFVSTVAPPSAPEILLAGIDLAWGEKKSDGVCFAAYDPTRKKARLAGYAYPQGDYALSTVIAERLAPGQGAFLAIDAPIVCPNLTGTRPVDRLTHTLFHRQHAACHPANLTKCPRPPRVLARLAADLGFAAGWEVGRDRRARRIGGRMPAEETAGPAGDR